MYPSDRPSSTSAKWKQLYESAILEPDYARLFDRIAEARTAIFDRAEEILTLSSDDERRALTRALRTLDLLEEAALHSRNAA
jgi:hypothetical protein